MFSPAGTLANARMGHAAVLLLDGRVVVAGGADPGAGTGVGVLEIWDPSSLQFHEDMGLLDAPKNVSLTRLPDGRVLDGGSIRGAERPARRPHLEPLRRRATDRWS